MIAGSLVLILAAAGLLLTGLLLPSDWLLAGSIVASLLAAVLLYVAGRQRALTHAVSRHEVASAGDTVRSARQPTAEEWVGGGADEEDPVDEPPIQRRPARVAAMVSGMDVEVLVIDGRPRYHVTGCSHVAGRVAEPLPIGEANELGFTPCALCEPDTVITSGAVQTPS